MLGTVAKPEGLRRDVCGWWMAAIAPPSAAHAHPGQVPVPVPLETFQPESDNLRHGTGSNA
jgi:hypothetical protein